MSSSRRARRWADRRAQGLCLDEPTPLAEVADTTGAGGAFAARFIPAELEGAGGAACLRRGVEAGSKAVTQRGGQPE